jgi:hypothetical protein
MSAWFEPKVRVAVACVASVLSCLTGCSTLSTGSSMQVEVEVYKGPLSREPQAQLGELCGTVEELEKNLNAYHDSLYLAIFDLPKSPFETLEQVYQGSAACDLADAYAVAEGITKKRAPIAKCWCDQVKGKRTYNQNLACMGISQLHDEVEGLRDEITSFKNIDKLAYESTCGVLAGTAKRDGSRKLIKVSKPVVSTTEEEMNQALESLTPASGSGQAAKAGSGPAAADPADELRRRHISQLSRLAVRLKLKAMYRAESDAILLNQDRTVRTLATSLSNLAAEYSNQISSRADAWLKQTDVAEAASLPQSVYLRDSQPTEFVNLYAWNRAAAPPLGEDILLHPIKSGSSEGTMDRVRGIERLFSDSYWSKINTVYASGQGDVSMALVKDDIGNWNLKSFSTDPTKLLKAYKDGGLALIQTASELGKTAAGVPNASKVLGFANALALGQTNPTGGDETSRLAEKLHAVTQQRLEKLRKSLDEQGAESAGADAVARAKAILSDYEDNLESLAEVSAQAAEDKKATTNSGIGKELSKGLPSVPLPKPNIN